MKNLDNKYSQLTLSQRITIEEMINQRKRKHEIANALNKKNKNSCKTSNKKVTAILNI